MVRNETVLFFDLNNFIHLCHLFPIVSFVSFAHSCSVFPTHPRSLRHRLCTPHCSLHIAIRRASLRSPLSTTSISSMVFVPPLNFSPVADGVYRSGHPLKVNYPFLETLNLKTIIYIGDRPDSENEEYFQWASDNNIRMERFHVKSVKEPFLMNDPVAMSKALEIVVDTRNLPVLVHSNKGKHRVGVLVGIMRKMLQGWSLAAIFDEYTKFAKGKGDADIEFIELFEPCISVDPIYVPSWFAT